MFLQGKKNPGWLFWLASGWLGLASGSLSGWLSGWLGLAPGWLSGWFGLAPGWLSGWFGLASFFSMFFLARLAETQLLESFAGLAETKAAAGHAKPHI